MRIAYITSGAAGMFCGSCIRDNSLVMALQELGYDALLIPTFTPIRTDEIDVSQGRLFYGGINVFLEDRWSLFRHTPRFVDWLFNRRWLIRLATRKSVNTNYAHLADLTLSMLRGNHGRQKKELAKLIEWLKTEVQPSVIILTNVLLSGIADEVKKQLQVPVITTLQGDDVFLDALPADSRKRCLDEIQHNDQAITAYISTSQFYADYMSQYLGVHRDKVHVIYPGLNLKGHGAAQPPREKLDLVLGYFARICPEKGLHQLVDAFLHLRKANAQPRVKLQIAGWLGDQHRGYLEEQRQKIIHAGLAEDFQYCDCPDHESKVKFFQSIDVLSVPTTIREPKGLYLLEAWANGVPVVQPRHGSFPELIEATGGGLLVEPGNPVALADAIRSLFMDPAKRHELGRKGQLAVHERFTAQHMAQATIQLLQKFSTR